MADESNTSLFKLPAPAQLQVIRVRLDSGAIVEREPAQLVALPAQLVAPLEELA